MSLTLEIIATSLADVEAINKSKADQIELVADLNAGGLTPDLKTIEDAVTLSKIPINVMLRPHDKSFVYTDDEFDNILTHLTKIKQLRQPPNGIVFGSLTNSNKINDVQLKQIIDYKGNLALVFHRAFDVLDNPFKGIETLNKYAAVTALLTSGTKAKAIDGVTVIKQLVQLSKTVKIMVGAGVNLKNIKLLKNKTGATAFHVGTAVRENGNIEGKILVAEIDKIKDVLVG